MADPRNDNSNLNWPTACRDIGISLVKSFRDLGVAMVNKGLIVPIILGFVLLICVKRMQPDQLGAVANRTIDCLTSHSGLGWGLSITVIPALSLTLHRQRKQMAKELERVSDLKSKLQFQLIGKEKESSK